MTLRTFYCGIQIEMLISYDKAVKRWSPRGRPWPRGQILKSLALKPQVLENCPVIGSSTTLFFEQLKFCWKTPETSRKISEDLFLFSSGGDRLKKCF